MTWVEPSQLFDSQPLAIVDVRSPSEFSRGHIPGAVNVPVFDDGERAEIGTLYKQVGRPRAEQRGIDIATGKAAQIVADIQQAAKACPVVLHCWRGGMRSRGVAWLCGDCGLQPTLLEGGYKAFRQSARRSFLEPRKVIVLAGQTGTGKTRLLEGLRQAGQQVIDLEGLAKHRGSVFGGIPGEPQPTVEQFENNLFLQWRRLNPDLPIWIEGESQAIGSVNIPAEFWHHMVDAPAIFLEVNRERRIEFLLREYAELPSDRLASAVGRLKKRLGGAKLQSALKALEQEDRREFASIAIDYYDKWYLKSLEKRPRETLVRMTIDDAGDLSAIPKLVACANELLSLHSG